MSVQRKRILALLTLVACIAILSIVFFQNSEKTGTYAAVPDGQTDRTPPGDCANTACNTFCWSDGTHHHNGTFAKQTIPTPVECSGTGGCRTVPCE